MQRPPINAPPELADAYDRAAMLASAASKAPQLLPAAIQALEDVRAAATGAPSDFRALVLVALAGCYRRSSTPDRRSALLRALACFKEAQRERSRERDPYRYATTCHNMGNVYTDLPGGDRSANLQNAIQCYRAALECFTSTDTPEEYAATMNAMGGAYKQLPTGNPAANVAAAIACFESALPLYASDDHKLDRAQVLVNLGHAQRRVERDRSTAIRAAIECYERALAIYQAAAVRAGAVQALTGLGSAYDELPSGDLADNRERALRYHELAARLLDSPQEREAHGLRVLYGRVQNNLGNAYRKRLAAGTRAENVERAIAAYERALEVFSLADTPFEWATAHNGLGLAYRERTTGEREANQAEAIAHFEQALRVRTPQADPRMHAMTQGNLGNAYIGSDTPRAIACYEAALACCPVDRFPFDYARTQMNLGNAHRALAADTGSGDVSRAVACFHEALRVFTLDADPGTHRAASANLGDTLRSVHDWDGAHAALASAVQATELEYRAGATPASREAELAQVKPLWAMDAYCLARLGRLAEAVERLEQGRTRALAEALARDRVALDEVPTSQREAFAAARERVRDAEALARRRLADPAVEPDAFVETSAAVADARAALDGVVQRIRSTVPDFMQEALDFAAIVAAGSATRPLVYLATIAQGSVALVAAPEPRVCWLDGLTARDLDETLLGDDDDGAAVGLLAGELAASGADLDAALEGLARVLRPELVDPLVSAVSALGPREATLVPTGRLGLLPLPALFPDGWVVALAPSARVLAAARGAAAEASGRPPRLLGVADPAPPPPGALPLSYAEAELDAVATYFGADARAVLPGSAATREAVLTSAAEATHLHFACHGAFVLTAPLESGLSLAAGERLTVADVLSGDLRSGGARLAVLSACQTGISDVERVPDEVIGLSAGFMGAGVAAVISTLWPIADMSTPLLVAELYRQLFEERADPAHALRAAQEHIQRTAAELGLADWFERRYVASASLDQDAFEAAAYFRAHPEERPFAAPRYWAGFVLSGG